MFRISGACITTAIAIKKTRLLDPKNLQKANKIKMTIYKVKCSETTSHAMVN